MSAPAIKAGMRCFCTEATSDHMHYGASEYCQGRYPEYRCDNEAVRLVPVQSWERSWDGKRDVAFTADMPFCEPCASYHEKARAAK